MAPSFLPATLSPCLFNDFTINHDSDESIACNLSLNDKNNPSSFSWIYIWLSDHNKASNNINRLLITWYSIGGCESLINLPLQYFHCVTPAERKLMWNNRNPKILLLLIIAIEIRWMIMYKRRYVWGR